jgi:hypothetical protein
MRIAVPISILVITIALAGCRSQQQAQQEDLASLQAKMKIANDQYNAACLTPLSKGNQAGVHAAVTDSAPPTPAPASPFDSPECKTASARVNDLFKQITALQNKAAGH